MRPTLMLLILIWCAVGYAGYPPDPSVSPNKGCDCKAACECSYCKSCPTQKKYSSCDCDRACKIVSDTPICKTTKCACPEEPACPPPCNCSASCICSYCNSCPTQTTYTSCQCQDACQKAKAPECKDVVCFCPRMPACPPKKNCNCSAICDCGYCNDCPTQTLYSKSQCYDACQQAKAPECDNVRCGCPAQPACPPKKNCNCSAICDCSYCNDCPTQTLYSKCQCYDACQQAKAPECDNVRCGCPAQPACPPKGCNCSAICDCGYCNNCPTQTLYSKSQCYNACQQAKAPGCENVRCGCPEQPACPPEGCSCDAKCFGPFCDSCPTQQTFPPQTCAIYAQQYKSPACKKLQCLFCPRIELYCPNPKNCNCSKSCICSFCNDCKTQDMYSNSECKEACDASNTPDCKAAKCNCPNQPACPPETCNCSAKCFGPFCASCPTQTFFPPQTCALYAQEYKSPACQSAKCFCPRIELYCPNPKNCNCSKSCICSYCNSCKTQTTYSNSTCQEACEASNTPDCKAAKCNCPRQPACPPATCNCSAKCFGPFCASCPTQTLFSPQTCAYYAQEYKSPACQTAKCFCPGIELYCPNPKNCNCSKSCICSYCNSCKTQTTYSNSTCQEACEASNTPDCKAAKCSCPAQPSCPPETCNCPAKCFGPFCASCPTQTLFPPQTCALYAQEYKSSACKTAKCICPGIELYCPNPKNCNCSKSCICSYCNSCKSQTTYSNSTCQEACEASNTPDCKAIKCNCLAQSCPSDKCNCAAFCNAPYCESCPNQIIYPPSTCASFIQEAKSPKCKSAPCPCPLVIPYCPKPENCDCEAACISSYCKSCPKQKIYSYSQCCSAEKKADTEDCRAAKCHCNEQPACCDPY